MKRKMIFLLLVVTALLLFSTVPAGAEAGRTPVNAVEYVCMNTPGSVWMEGNVYHVRGQVNENVVMMDGQVWGVNTASINFDYNLKTGQLVIHGRADFVPLGVQGGYAGVGFFRVMGAGSQPMIGISVFQGYGDLAGQSVHLADMVTLGPTDPNGNAYCAGHGQYFDTTLWNGYILDSDS
ncbi:MAG: hypothetical protein ACM3PS_08015 [Syntrophothermus sp.]